MATMVETGLSSVDLGRPSFGMIPASLVPTVWPVVEEILQTKAKPWLETVSEAEVFGWLIEGRCDLWLGVQDQVVDGFVVANWEVNDRRRRYVVVYIAGAGLDKYIVDGLAKLEQYCSILGGTELVLEGRKGWVRKLRRYGYGQYAVKMRKSTKVLWRN